MRHHRRRACRVALATVALTTLAAPQAAHSEILADSGFTVAANALPFANYGSGHTDLTAVEMRKLFGDRVCGSAPSDTCELTPAARKYADDMNKSMSGGHCAGMSVAALRLFKQATQPSVFGAPAVPQLAIDKNAALSREIAYGFVFQALGTVKEKSLTAKPSEIVNRLKTEFAARTETWTIGIQKEGGADGHAMTPTSIESVGENKVKINVWDNNYPGQLRAINVDIAAETWSYNGASNPAIPEAPYTGKGGGNMMEIQPTGPGQAVQTCTFCDDSAAAPASGRGRVAVKARGDGKRNPRVKISRGKKSITTKNGKVRGSLPGATAQRLRVGAPLKGERFEPDYSVPAGRAYTVELNNDTKATGTQGISLVGPGWYLNVHNVVMKPRERVTLKVAANGRSVSFRSNRKLNAPVIALGVTELGPDHEFVLKRTSGLAKGKSLRLTIDVKAGKLRVHGGKGVYDFAMRYVDQTGAKSFVRNGVTIADTDDPGETDAAFDYEDWNGEPGDDIGLDIDGEHEDLTSQVAPTTDFDDAEPQGADDLPAPDDTPSGDDTPGSTDPGGDDPDDR